MDEKEIIEQELFKDTSRYRDIIDYPYTHPKGHLPMPQASRGGQFSPFAALTGFGSLIQKKGEAYQNKKYLSEHEEEAIFALLSQIAGTSEVAVIKYFNEEVGLYEEFNDQITVIKEERGRVYFKEHLSVPLLNIREVRLR